MTSQCDPGDCERTCRFCTPADPCTPHDCVYAPAVRGPMLEARVRAIYEQYRRGQVRLGQAVARTMALLRGEEEER